MLTVNSQWDEWEWIFFPKWGWWQRWKACKRFFVSRRRYNNIARRDVESERGIAVVWLVNGMNLIRLPNKKLNNAIRRGGIPCMKHSRDIYLSPVFKRPEFFNVPDKTGHVGKLLVYWRFEYFARLFSNTACLKKTAARLDKEALVGVYRGLKNTAI